MRRYLLSTLNRDMIKPQDVKTVLGVVAANPDGQLLAWRHLKARWITLQSLFGNGTFTMGGLITAVTSHFASEYDYREVRTCLKNFKKYKRNVNVILTSR